MYFLPVLDARPKWFYLDLYELFHVENVMNVFLISHLEFMFVSYGPYIN
jgi:hypothetical protein